MVIPHHHVTWWHTLWLTLPVFGSGVFDLIFGIFTTIFDVGQVVFNSIQAAVNWAITVAIPLIWSAIEWVTKTVATGFGFVARSLTNVFTWVSKHLVNLWNDYEDFRRKYLGWLSTVKRWVHTVRGWVKKYWIDPHLRLVNLLQRFRLVLAPFRLLHLRFAQELDATIARLEGKVIRNTLSTVREINRVANIVDLVIDPFGLITRPTIVGSWLRALNDFSRGLFGRDLESLLGGRGTGPDPRIGSVHLGEVWSDWNNQITTGSGTVARMRESYKPVLDSLRSRVGTVP